MSDIELRGVSKRFGSTGVLDAVDLAVSEGSITAILGRSGSGKSTLLRIIAGFEHVDAGTVFIDGNAVDDSRRFVPAQHRGIGYVPQDGALFPHLTALGNIGFGLSRGERPRARELLDFVGLGELGDRRPHELSGGQQQRVALARALAVRPRVVLLDEPFSSLDAALRVSVRQDVARILRESGTTAIIVTHDQEEALSMADHVAVLADGRILASATPRELYSAPPNEAAAAHLGEINVLPARFAGGMAHCVLGDVPVVVDDGAASGRIVLRSEQVVVHDAVTSGAVTATVTRFDFYGHDALVHLVLDGEERVVARVDGNRTLTVGETVWLSAQGAALAL